MEIKGFIFDVDGTLVNSTPLHFKSWNTILARYEISLTPEEIYAQFGKTPLQVAKGYLKNSPHLNPKEIMKEKTEYFMDHLHELIIFPYVEEFLTMLNRNKIPYILASNGAKKTIEKMIKTLEFLSNCKGYVAFEDVTNGKPHPDMILKSLDLLALPPSQVMMVGDSSYDIQAGSAANTYTIAIESAEHSHDFQKLAPTFIISEFKAIQNIQSQFLSF